MRKSSRVTWGFSLTAMLFVLALLTAGRSNLPYELVYKYARDDPARADELFSALDTRQGNGGWLHEVNELREPDPIDPPDLSIIDTGIGLVFAHIGDGRISSKLSFKTTFLLVNQTRNSTNGVIEFYDDSGKPLVVTLDGVTESTIPFTLNSGETKRFQTSGEGEIKVGWAHVHSEQPIGGTATFGIQDGSGRVLTDVGVEASPAGTEFMIFADMVGDSRTGLGLANPKNQIIEVQFQLYDGQGTLKGTLSNTIQPFGHFSIFLDELFASVGGIGEFEGSVFLTSDQKFGGITLRSTGDQLTSMPMIQPPAAEWTKIAFGHAGDGTDSASGLRIATAVILMNNRESLATGTVDFYSSAGDPLVVTIDGKSASSFDFSLAPKAVARLETSGGGKGIKTGFAVVSMDLAINGTALFSLYNNSTGVLNTEVGVGSTPLQKKASFVADSMGDFNTGVAVAYPLPEDAGAENDVTMSLYSSAGLFQGSTTVTLPTFQHSAKFMTELFPDVADIDEFLGRIDISANQYVALVSLRQAGTKLTSMPYFQKPNGFAPVSDLDFAETLAGSSPAVFWRLTQNSNDFALDSLNVKASGLGLNTSGVEIGDRIGYGRFVRGTDSRVYEMRLRELGSLKFDLIEAGADGSKIIGDGVFDGSESANFSLDLQFQDKQPFTYVGSDIVLEFWVLPGLVDAPSKAGSVPVTTEFSSVSIDPTEDIRLTRRTTETLTFQSPDVSLANLYKVSPVFLRPGVEATMEGDHFGESPLVLFDFELFDTNTWQSSHVEVPVIPTFTPDQRWVVQLPHLTSSEPTKGFASVKSLRVNNGLGPGNSYATQTNFSPIFHFSPASKSGGEEVSFSFSFEQNSGQFAIAGFQVGIFGAEADFTGFEVGDALGMGLNGSTEYNLVVQTVEESQITADVVQEGSTSPFGTMTFQRFPEAAAGEGLPDLGILYEEVSPVAGPNLIQTTFKMEWSITGLPIQLPESGNPVQATGIALSTATSDSALSGILSESDTFFLTEGGSN